VESIDVKDRQVKLRTRVGMETKTFTITTAEKTEIKRYAPDSVKFTDAVASHLDEIKKGDQLRALGVKDEANSRLTAERVVFGTFRTFAGTVTSVDAAAKSLQLKEIDGKKTLTVRATADSTVKAVPPQMGMMMSRMAQMGGGGPMGAGGGVQGGGPMGGGMARAGGSGPQGSPGGPRTGPVAGGPGVGPGGPGSFRPGGGPPDIANMLDRMPVADFASLKPGDTVIVASTLGARQDDYTAITLLAGAQPILDMLAASQQAAQMRAGAGLSIGGSGGMGGGMGGGEGGLSGLGIGMMP